MKERLIYDNVPKVFFVVFIIGMILVIIHFLNPKILYGEVYTKESYLYNISAIEDNRDIYGRMYYRSGYIQQDLYYYIMRDNGSYKDITKIPASKTIIVETDKETPKVVYYGEYFKRTNKALLNTWCYNTDYYLLYVPEGTTTSFWNIDMQ